MRGNVWVSQREGADKTAHSAVEHTAVYRSVSVHDENTYRPTDAVQVRFAPWLSNRAPLLPRPIPAGVTCVQLVDWLGDNRSVVVSGTLQ